MKNNRTVSSRAKRISCLLGVGGGGERLWIYDVLRTCEEEGVHPSNNEFLDN